MTMVRDASEGCLELKLKCFLAYKKHKVYYNNYNLVHNISNNH